MKAIFSPHVSKRMKFCCNKLLYIFRYIENIQLDWRSDGHLVIYMGSPVVIC
jgi:hypothetical protein